MSQEVTTLQTIVFALGTNLRRKSWKSNQQTISRTQSLSSNTVEAYQALLPRRSLHTLEFPPLIPEATYSQIHRHWSSPHKDIDSVPHSNEEMVVTEEITGLNIFNNSVHFLAFLAAVIQQTILATQRNHRCLPDYSWSSRWQNWSCIGRGTA